MPLVIFHLAIARCTASFRISPHSTAQNVATHSTTTPTHLWNAVWRLRQQQHKQFCCKISFQPHSLWWNNHFNPIYLFNLLHSHFCCHSIFTITVTTTTDCIIYASHLNTPADSTSWSLRVIYHHSDDYYFMTIDSIYLFKWGSWTPIMSQLLSKTGSSRAWVELMMLMLWWEALGGLIVAWWLPFAVHYSLVSCWLILFNEAH